MNTKNTSSAMNITLVKKLHIFLLLQLILICGVAQNEVTSMFGNNGIFSKYAVSIEIEKNEFSIAENIYVKFKIDFIEDSIQNPKFDGFKIISGPNASKSRNMVNGVTTQTKTISYVLKPNNSGDCVIESPIFFINGKEVKGQKIITILNTVLTKEEQSEVGFRKFVESPFKKEGTFRYVVSDEFGYIEISKGINWEFYRKLTEKELKQIKKIK
jgi:uncharacterized protein YbcV (DUF1398 family)